MLKAVRYILGGVLVLGAIVLLMTPGRAREQAPRGRTVIRYWEKWTGQEGAQMKSIVDWFNRTVGAERNIYVAYVSISQVDQKTLTSTAAGDPPEVAGLWGDQVAQFAALGALEPLTDRAAARGFTQGYFKPVFFNGCSYRDTLYALPSTPWVIALHYNKTLFEAKADKLRAAGLDPSRPPATVDELDRYAAVLDEWEGEPGRSRLKVAGFLPQEPGWWLPLNSYWFGGPVYDPATRQVTLTSEPVLASTRWIDGYRRRLGVDTMRQFRASLSTSFDTPQAPFFTGQVAMQLEGTWKANYISVHKPEMNNRGHLPADQLAALSREQRRENCTWGVAPFPAYTPATAGSAYCGMDVLVIPRTAKHKDEAFEFLAFVNRQDVSEKLNSMHCKVSPLVKTSSAFLDKHPNPYIEVFEKLAESPNAFASPRLPIWPAVASEISTAIEQIYLGQKGLDDALADTQRRCQAKVDQFFERQRLHGVPAEAAAVTNGNLSRVP